MTLTVVLSEVLSPLAGLDLIALLNPALSGSKPLMAEADSATTSIGRTSNGKPPTSPLNPALTVIGIMGRVMGAYAEFPARLAQCRSPMDIWSEQARFV